MTGVCVCVVCVGMQCESMTGTTMIHSDLLPGYNGDIGCFSLVL